MRHGARETVNDAAFGSVWGAVYLTVPWVYLAVGIWVCGAEAQSAVEQRDDDIISDEVAAVDDCLGALSDRCLHLNFLA